MNEQYIRSISLQRDSVHTWDEYPFNLPAVRHLYAITFHPHVTFIVGENGSGKSTLLEAIAIKYGLNAEGGSKNMTFSTQSTHSSLHTHIRLTKGVARPKDAYFLRAETYYNVATNIDELDEEGGGAPIKSYYGGTSLHEQSHGESFFALFMHRLFGNGLYILDEPEAALSPMRQLTLLKRLDELVQKNSQFIIATHSPILLAYPHANIITLNEHAYTERTYKETDHYLVTKKFLEDTQTMLQAVGIEQSLEAE